MWLEEVLSFHLLIDNKLHTSTFLLSCQLSHVERLNDACNNKTSFGSWIFSLTGDSEDNTDPLMMMSDGGEQ